MMNWQLIASGIRRQWVEQSQNDVECKAIDVNFENCSHNFVNTQTDGRVNNELCKWRAGLNGGAIGLPKTHFGLKAEPGDYFGEAPVRYNNKKRNGSACGSEGDLHSEHTVAGIWIDSTVTKLHAKRIQRAGCQKVLAVWAH